MKAVLPWVLAVVLGAAWVALHHLNERYRQQLTAIRGEFAAESMARMRGDSEPLATASFTPVMLSTDARQLLRLSNELRQLQYQRKQVEERAGGETPEQQLQKISASIDQLRTENIRLEQLEIQARAACVANLRQIDAMKAVWISQTGQGKGAATDTAQIAALFPDHMLPMCPAGGMYQVNRVGSPPACSIPGHELSGE
jgi:hypothetical protein